MIDFTVDVFGLANRRSGAYNLVRAAGLGYFWGNSNARDGAASTCQYLQNDVQVGGRLVPSRSFVSIHLSATQCSRKTISFKSKSPE